MPTADATVLVPGLRRLIEAAFGPTRVSHAGRPLVFKRRVAPGRAAALDVSERGETYAACCPHCGDRDFTLRFSHRYGSAGFGDYPGLWLVRCRASRCHREPGVLRGGYAAIFGTLGEDARRLVTAIDPEAEARGLAAARAASLALAAPKVPEVMKLAVPKSPATRKVGPGRARGSAHGQAKLVEADVQAIRARFSAGGVTMRALGNAFGVSLSVVHGIVHRKAWVHVA